MCQPAMLNRELRLDRLSFPARASLFAAESHGGLFATYSEICMHGGARCSECGVWCVLLAREKTAPGGWLGVGFRFVFWVETAQGWGLVTFLVYCAYPDCVFGISAFRERRGADGVFAQCSLSHRCWFGARIFSVTVGALRVGSFWHSGNGPKQQHPSYLVRKSSQRCTW